GSVVRRPAADAGSVPDEGTRPLCAGHGRRRGGAVGPGWLGFVRGPAGGGLRAVRLLGRGGERAGFSRPADAGRDGVRGGRGQLPELPDRAVRAGPAGAGGGGRNAAGARRGGR